MCEISKIAFVAICVRSSYKMPGLIPRFAKLISSNKSIKKTFDRVTVYCCVICVHNIYIIYMCLHFVHLT